MARLLYVSYFRITARGPFKLPVPASQTLLIIPLPLLTLSADYAPYVTNSRAPHPDLRNSPQCTQSPDQCPLSDLGNLAVPKPAQRSRLRTLLLGSQDCASRRGKKQLGQVKSAQQMLSAPQAMASISNIQHLQQPNSATPPQEGPFPRSFFLPTHFTTGPSPTSPKFKILFLSMSPHHAQLLQSPPSPKSSPETPK